MYSSVLLAFSVVLFTDTSLASSAQYTVVSQHALQGWSYELANINRVQCLLACSRKIYCLSVNYNRQDRLCQINKLLREESSIANFLQAPSFEYIEKVLDKDFKKHGVFTSTDNTNTYEEASEMCSKNLGSLASYEHLYNAFQPRLDNCTEGWLISGEIAFTEISGDKCTLKSPDQRSNVFPCKTYPSGYYCYREYNQSLDIFDCIPKIQRIVRLTESKSKKLSANKSEVRCSNDFGGRLATPFEVYNASYSLGVDLCIEGWHSGWLAGNPCTGNIPSEFWFYPTGNEIMLMYPMNEYFAMCYIPLPNQNLTFPDPFPPHRVMHVQGVAQYSLTYQDAKTRCIGYGGMLATREQVEYAQSCGYDCCSAGWVESGEVIYPITHPGDGHCDNIFGIKSWGFRDHDSTYGGYCYIL